MFSERTIASGTIFVTSESEMLIAKKTTQPLQMFNGSVANFWDLSFVG
jgi:hypothetical protein